MRRVPPILGICLLTAGLVVLSLPDEVWSRAGGGLSGGSRGSRTYSSPSRSYTPPPRPSSPSTAPAPRPTDPSPLPTPSPAGGFWRALAGGALGGILGGMLFRGMGYAGGAGEFGGGFGLMDLLLLGGIAYLIYWMVKRGRRSEEATAGGYYGRMAAEPNGGAEPSMATMEPPASAGELERGLSHIRQMDPRFDEAAFKEWCSDTFFRIQAAWMHRDVERLRPMLGEEMLEVFRTQLEDLRAKRRINTLENIAIRSIELTEAWQEQGQDYVTVRYLANLLDYTVDEATGKVVEGSDREPVKFEEYWTWVRPVGPNPWRLTAIQQAG